MRNEFWLQIETRNQQINTLETTKTSYNQFGAILRVFTETLEIRKLEMRREERRDLPMEWMRVRDLSSSFDFPNFGRFHGRRRDGGVTLSLVLSFLFGGHNEKKEGDGAQERKEKKGRGKNDKGAHL